MADIDHSVARRIYARQMVGLLGVADKRLENAFAAVPRENFLGAGSWTIKQWPNGSVALPSNDPLYIYQDVLVSLDPARGVNNGSPSLHARMMRALSPRPGSTIAHIGAGAGYYSAILAEMVGPAGHVTAVEFDPDLAAKARINLAPWENVRVVAGDGALWPQSAVDGIYVNFAVGKPAAAWIDNLSLGGRLVFPLGVAGGKPGMGPRNSRGAVLQVTKAETIHPAKLVSPASFVFAEGDLLSSPEEQARLGDAFTRGGLEFVGSLAWRTPVDPSRCWYVASDWALRYDPPPGR
ncbi:MAG TPA: rRNA adenine N-6-methyltransferase family protein [Devosia sp.]|nr:rRNA adenine N-6-methyltransferase family protein [Devosia sp.]